MNNKMKMLAIVAVLVSSVAQVDAFLGDKVKDTVRELAGEVVGENEAHSSWDWKAVSRLNNVHSWFPGTYPLNEIKEERKTGYLPEWCWEQSELRVATGTEFGVFRRSIHPSIQLGFTVLLKWLPVALIVRGIYKVATKKKKKHHKKHDEKAHHVALNA